MTSNRITSRSVTIEFSHPRKCRRVKESYLLTADGQPDLFLPISQTVLKELESGLVESATVPEYIANDSERDWGDIVPRDDDI